jgi:hypothetical protein
VEVAFLICTANMKIIRKRERNFHHRVTENAELHGENSRHFSP